MQTKVILNYLFFLIAILHTNICNANTKDILPFDGIWTDTTDMSENSVWFYTGDNPSCTDEPIIMINVARSVVIGDMLCRVLSVSINDVIYPESEIAVFYKDKRMYFYEDEEWKILYDFNMNVGDTLDYQYSEINGYYYNPFDTTYKYQIVVYKVDTVFANNGQPLRRLFTRLTSEQGFEEGENVSVEDMGSIYTLFGLQGTVITEGCHQYLRCFTNGDYLYRIRELCGPSRTLQETSSSLQMIPNPGNDVINITLTDGVDFPITYEVVSMTGQKIISGTASFPSFDIVVGALTSATYIVRCSDKNGQQWYGRWVKM